MAPISGKLFNENDPNTAKNKLGEKCLSYLMKIVIESLQKLTAEGLEAIIGIWTRKARKIVV